MKSIFRNLKSLALVAFVGFAAFAVSCKPDEPVTPTTPTNVEYEFEGGNNVFFEAGEKKSVAVKDGQSLEGATIVAPEGWSIVVVGNSLEITAPTQESVDAKSAVAYGDVELTLEVEDTNYSGKLGVYMGEIVAVDLVANSFKDVEVKAVITVDKYLVHLGTNGEWQAAFDEWKNTQDGWNPMDFGWDGEYYGVFEGSLFTFADNPYKPNYCAVPGTAYQLAILPLEEGKNATEYTYDNIYLFDFETIEAGQNGTVVPTFTLESASHDQINVKVDATGAYMTYYKIYSVSDYNQIGEDRFASFVKGELPKKGEIATEEQFTISERGLDENETIYLAAMSIDNNGNYGEITIQDFTSTTFAFNENIKVTLGEITCSDDGKTVYIPVSVEGGEVDHYRCSYVTNESEWGFQRYGGSVEKAEIVIATATNEYSGPKFYYPEGEEEYDENGNQINKTLVDGKIVVTQGPYPGAKARILVLVIDKNGMPSHAAYAEFTPTDTKLPVIYSTDEGYEYGMPSVTYKGVTKGMKGDEVIYTVDFNLYLGEGTATAWMAVANEDYTIGHTPYMLITRMMDGSFMFAKEFTTDGVFNADILYAQNDTERKSAAFVCWLDDKGYYHEVKLMYEPVLAAQDDIKKALAEMQ